jgi:hypothetical protein
MKTPETRLEKHVAKWLKSQSKDYDGEYKERLQSVYDDLMQGGCISGMVGHLIYYYDTVRFYKNYRQEIDTLLSELLQDTGCSISELFGEKWDNDDPLARDIYNQNLLAWFGFEETATRLVDYSD